MGKNNKGRITDLEKTPELGKKLIELITRGVAQKHACELVGVGTTTFYAWIQRGELKGAKKCYKEFRDAIMTARQAFVQKHLDNISAQGARQWQASAWMLERCGNGSHHFANPELIARHRLEEIEKVLVDLRALAIARGVIEEGDNALPQE